MEPFVRHSTYLHWLDDESRWVEEYAVLSNFYLWLIHRIVFIRSGAEELFLYNNTLAGTIPTQIGWMTSLKILYLEQNSFVGTIPSKLAELSDMSKSIWDVMLYDQWIGSNTCCVCIPQRTWKFLRTSSPERFQRKFTLWLIWYRLTWTGASWRGRLVQGSDSLPTWNAFAFQETKWLEVFLRRLEIFLASVSLCRFPWMRWFCYSFSHVWFIDVSSIKSASMASLESIHGYCSGEFMPLHSKPAYHIGSRLFSDRSPCTSMSLLYTLLWQREWSM